MEVVHGAGRRLEVAKAVDVQGIALTCCRRACDGAAVDVDVAAQLAGDTGSHTLDLDSRRVNKTAGSGDSSSESRNDHWLRGAACSRPPSSTVMPSLVGPGPACRVNPCKVMVPLLGPRRYTAKLASVHASTTLVGSPTQPWMVIMSANGTDDRSSLGVGHVPLATWIVTIEARNLFVRKLRAAAIVGYCEGTCSVVGVAMKLLSMPVQPMMKIPQTLSNQAVEAAW